MRGGERRWGRVASTAQPRVSGRCRRRRGRPGTPDRHPDVGHDAHRHSRSWGCCQVPGHEVAVGHPRRVAPGQQRRLLVRSGVRTPHMAAAGKISTSRPRKRARPSTPRGRPAGSPPARAARPPGAGSVVGSCTTPCSQRARVTCSATSRSVIRTGPAAPVGGGKICGPSTSASRSSAGSPFAAGSRPPGMDSSHISTWGLRRRRPGGDRRHPGRSPRGGCRSRQVHVDDLRPGRLEVGRMAASRSTHCAPGLDRLTGRPADAGVLPRAGLQVGVGVRPGSPAAPAKRPAPRSASTG